MKSRANSSRGAKPIVRPASAAHSPEGWTFLSNHAHVLICLDAQPDLTLRAVAERVGITERAVQKIVAELEEAGYLTRQRDGRRNTYQIHRARPLRHPVEQHHSIGDLLRLVGR
jgi:predicted transcriptional regulator